jgi:hypothetical protein
LYIVKLPLAVVQGGLLLNDKQNRLGGGVVFLP